MRTLLLSLPLRRICLLLFLCSVFVPNSAPVTAQDLQFDQRCFTRSQCAELRESQLGPDLGDGFVRNNLSQRSCTGFVLMNESDGDVGFCIAGKKIETVAGFGGRRSFDDIADFITYIFRFSFSIATALAVIMIVVAGIQWMSSGGNSSTIGEAKKRISGALLGLFLIALSYTILRTVNPGLVSFRPLEIYMVNPVETAPEWCKDLNPVPPLYLAAKNGETKRTPLPTAVQEGSVILDDLTGDHCGNQYYIQNAGEQTCRVHVCPDNKTCVPFTAGGNSIVTEDKYSCLDGKFIMSLKLTPTSQPIIAPLTGGGVEKEWLAGYNIFMLPICQTRDNRVYFQQSGAGHAVAKEIQITPTIYTKEKEPFHDYYLKLPDNIYGQIPAIGCHSGDGVAGVIFKLRLGIDWRVDKQFFIGANGRLVADPNELLREQAYVPTVAFFGENSFFYEYILGGSAISEAKIWICSAGNTITGGTRYNDHCE